jgi:hypothetical protein
LQKLPNTIDITVRSNESEGQEMNAFFAALIPRLTTVEIIAWILFAIMIAKTVNDLLKKYERKIRK